MGNNIQVSNATVCLKLRNICPAGNEIIDACLLAEDLLGIDSSLLESLVLVKVSMENVDVGTVPELPGHLLLGGRLVTDQPDDDIVRVVGELVEEFELREMLC